MKIAIAGAMLASLLVSCTASRPVRSLNQTGNYCDPTLVYQYNDKYRPQPAIPTDTSLTNHFSPHDLHVANAIGIIPLLQKLAQLPQNQEPQTRLDRTDLSQRIQSRLLLASTEIASLAAELDCEGERADQLATYLDQKDQKHVRNLTLLSVVVGAITTVATAFIQADGVDKTVGIGGGLISAGLGGAAAFSSNRSVPFLHERNLLADIWSQNEQSAIYSPFIWYVLNEKSFSNTNQTSIRANIRRRWQSYVVVEATAQEQHLYFGPGGRYEADDLHTRANMLNQLQASVRSINQDLQALMAYFVR